VTGRAPPDFLAVGHVTLDRQQAGSARPGGAALYAAVTASKLGLRAAILTRASSDEPLANLPESIEIVRLPSRQTTEFVNIYSGEGRKQRVHALADAIGPADVPQRFRASSIVLLAPVIGEVAPDTRLLFDGLVGVAAQGWLRTVSQGLVRFKPWTADAALPRSQVVFASSEDASARALPRLVQHWLSMVQLVCITEGSLGGALYAHSKVTRWRALPAQATDPTGAGDVFAAAFLARYAETSDPYESTALAAAAASCSVEGEGTSAIVDRLTVHKRREEANG
jgi:1D-myo-inositol 3-kinase